MTALDTDDLAVVTGPLTLEGMEGSVYLHPGEVVRVLDFDEGPEFPYVIGLESDYRQYIDATSLTPLSDIDAISGADGSERATAPLHADTEVLWGEKPYVTYSEIHDYVYEEDNE